MRPIGELYGKNIVVYDLEIKREIGSQVDGKTITWDTHDLMEISVGCAFDYRTRDFSVHLGDNLKELADRLNSADLVVAFNHINFDNRLMRASGLELKPDAELKNYDMLLESRKGIGWKESDPFPKGCRLDDHLECTFGDRFKKTANGEEAPRMFQRGEMGKLISYCLADVARERMLFEYIWATGIARTKTNGIHVFKHPSLVLEAAA